MRGVGRLTSRRRWTLRTIVTTTQAGRHGLSHGAVAPQLGLVARFRAALVGDLPFVRRQQETRQSAFQVQQPRRPVRIVIDRVVVAVYVVHPVPPRVRVCIHKR